MTIHHDKLAYGRLKGLNEELSAEDIAKLVEELNDEEEEDESAENAESAVSDK